MGEQIPDFTNYKQRGEWVEMMFMARAAAEGLQVSSPYGDSATYDVIVEHGARCLRIQVKSTTFRVPGGFRCEVRGRKRAPYPRDSFDFVAALVLTVNAWFIIPELEYKPCLCLSPGRPSSRYYEYEEAWHLLKPEPRRKKSARTL